ncbi:5-oxoprolinase subunit PxpA [Galbibacter sp. EGI 63066]|uniref:5-oxoprolinase subunit PxpA n=1 Tax=Galbibacter sp. EGI 63066 TaxID=2993559 RepID=UPI002248C022|nr:5-oxoprolinase subunit PxpA [Galbibacter sp. EGI 63066]MCX2681487.1 5-oxoprolinase subunit PxpA [Galbibacter sp. EGI 63066]
MHILLGAKKTQQIDINCDLGEGTSNESELMPYIQSCNIACGGHAGDESTMKEVVKLAVKHQVKIGAHPSYPDRENFGRKSISISAEKLISSIQEQIQLMDGVLGGFSAKLHHIKPHGALYNDIAKDEKRAAVFLQAIRNYKEKVALYVPYNSVIAKKAKGEGFSIIYEAFADRSYNPDLSLVARSKPNAVLTDVDAILKQVLSVAKEGRVTAVDGSTVPIKADTFCVHSDTENATDIVKYLYNQLHITTLG